MLPQKQLAQTLGTTQEWISQFETGRLEYPSLGTVLKAFATLGIDRNIDSVPAFLDEAAPRQDTRQEWPIVG